MTAIGSVLVSALNFELRVFIENKLCIKILLA